MVASHLLALAANHHLGIVRPLRYPSIATSGNIYATIAVMWLLPHLVMFVFFLSHEQGFLHESRACPADFMHGQMFRLAFGVTLGLPLAIMIGLYMDILVVIHEQTAVWVRGKATGSCRHKGNRSFTHKEISSSRHRLMVS